MRNTRLLSHIQGCAVGVTLEALGVHHETLTADEILTLTGGRGLTGLTPPLKPLRFQSVRKIPLGGTSDDWQLWGAVARSLLHRGGQFDRVDMAREHVLELDRRTHGWGSSTEDGARLAKRAFDFGGVAGMYPEIPPRKKRKPFPGENPKGKGCGNGVGMKVGPLAVASLMDGRDETWLWNACRELGELTHPNPRAWIAAYALAWCVRACLRRAQHGVEPIRGPIEADGMFEALGKHMSRIEPAGDDRFVDRLRLLDWSTSLRSPEALRAATGTSCYALESVPFVIGSFLRHAADYASNVRSGVLEVLNAGGDTDSNVGMYASLVGANAGLDALPNDWLAQIPDSNQALAIGTALARMVEESGFSFDAAI